MRSVRRKKQSVFLAWRVLFSKYQKASQLCFEIYLLKVAKRVLRAWHDYSVLRVKKCRIDLIQLSKQNYLKSSLYIWKDYFKRIRQQRHAIQSINRVVMSQVWSTWMTLVKDKLKVKNLFKLVILNRMRERMNQWIKKVKNHNVYCIQFNILFSLNVEDY